MRKLLLSTAMVLMAMLGIGCGSGSSTTGGSAASSKPFRIPNNNPPIRYERKMHVNAWGLSGSEPKPVIPNSPPPKFLSLTDLIEGIGHLYASGDKMTVQYAGYDYETGKKFASSWDEGKPFAFTLGSGETVPGWEEGLDGIEGGDRRELVVPPDLAEGSLPPGIPEGKNVVFLVEPLPFKPKEPKKAAPKPKKDASSPSDEKPPAEPQAASKKTKPKVKVPQGPPPEKLVIKDLEEGSGPEARPGDEVTVQYVGVNYRTGKQFDASWDRGEPFTFKLGEGLVVEGWEKGIPDMKPGGRRELIIPPELGYGYRRQEGIPPGSTLVFVVDLLKIK